MQFQWLKMKLFFIIWKILMLFLAKVRILLSLVMLSSAQITRLVFLFRRSYFITWMADLIVPSDYVPPLIQTVQMNTCFYSFLLVVTLFAVFMNLLKLTNLYKEGSSQALLMLCNRTVDIILQMGTCLCSTVQCSSARWVFCSWCVLRKSIVM